MDSTRFNPCFFFTVTPHCPVVTHWVGTITGNYVIHLPIEPQAGVQAGAWHIWLHFGFWWHQGHGYMSCLSMGCSRFRNQHRAGHVLFFPNQTRRFPSWCDTATLSLVLPALISPFLWRLQLKTQPCRLWSVQGNALMPFAIAFPTATTSASDPINTMASPPFLSQVPG